MSRISHAWAGASTQALEIENARLEAAGGEAMRTKTVSAASREGHVDLPGILDFLRQGDEPVARRLDRLGRSSRDVLDKVRELDGTGASLRVLEPEVTTAEDLGRLVVTILDIVADMEVKFIRDRQRAGIEAANASGFCKGRKKPVDEDRIRQLAAEQVPKAPRPRPQDIADACLPRPEEWRRPRRNDRSGALPHRG